MMVSCARRERTKEKVRRRMEDSLFTTQHLAVKYRMLKVERILKKAKAKAEAKAEANAKDKAKERIDN